MPDLFDSFVLGFLSAYTFVMCNILLIIESASTLEKEKQGGE